MTYTNVHKANLGLQLRIFYTGSFSQSRPRPNELTQMPSNDPPERYYMGARMTKMKPQGRAEQTSYTNVHKGNLGSQLSIFYAGSFARVHPCPNDLPERIDMDAFKLPTRTH